jgi:acid phosphatase (class A)
MRLFTLALLGTCLLAPAMAGDMARMDGSVSFVGTDALNPTRILPPPPANDSFQTIEELRSLHQIAADATKAQVAAALADSKNETVFLFANATDANFTAAQFPATAALFKKIAIDGEFFEQMAKKTWQRPRPYVFDKSLIPACGASKKPSFSYPSGHAIEVWTQGTVLAALLPSHATAIEIRAANYAFEREICGSHYPSDLEAGHLLGVALADKILASAGFQREAAAARNELARVK